MPKLQLMQAADRFLIHYFPAIEKKIRGLWYNRFLFKKAQMTKWGFRMTGEQEMIEARYEPIVEALFVKLLPKIDVFVNIGANIGYYSLIARQHGKHVIAVEPMRSNLEIFFRNIMSNKGFDDIEVFPVALADRTGVIEIFGGGTGASLTQGWAGSPGYVTSFVPVSTLNAITGNRFDGKRVLVMADMEGAEYRMLLKSDLVLNSNPKPYWIIEIAELTHQNSGDKNPHTQDVFNLFWKRDYRSYDIDEGIEITPENLGSIHPPSKSYLGSGSNIFFFDKKEELPV